MRIVQSILLLAASCAVLYGCNAGGRAQPPARLTILVSGNTMGYLRNCGCASGQFGGELRRARLLKQEREDALDSKPSDKGRGSSVLVMDQGSTLGGEEFIDRLYSRQVLKSMAQTGYDMIGLGESDLLFGQKDLHDYLVEISQGTDSTGKGELPLTAVNLHFETPEAGDDYSSELNALIQKYRIVELDNGFRVGIIHAIDPGVTINDSADGEDLQKRFGFSILPIGRTTQQVIDQHGRDADFWIFSLGDGVEGVAEPQDVADIEGLDLVIGFEQANPNQAAGSGEVVYPFFVKGPILKARDLVKIVVNFPASEDDDMTITSQHLAVHSNIKGDEVVLSLIEDIWPEIERWELEENEKRTGHVRPQVVGQDTCRTCHANIHAAMLLTKHQHAYESLELRAEEDSEFNKAFKDPNCLRCHVTLYNSEHGGWNKLEPDPELQKVTCESCHGPGEYHVMLRSGTPVPDDLMEDGRNEHGLLPVTSETCMQCHDMENSPKFRFDEYWEKIRHSIDMPVPEDTEQAQH